MACTVMYIQLKSMQVHCYIRNNNMYVYNTSQHKCVHIRLLSNKKVNSGLVKESAKVIIDGEFAQHLLTRQFQLESSLASKSSSLSMSGRTC